MLNEQCGQYIRQEYCPNQDITFVWEDIYTESEYLTKGSAKRAVKYMDEFYRIINDNDLSRSVFQEKPNCLEPPPGLYD